MARGGLEEVVWRRVPERIVGGQERRERRRVIGF